MIGNAGNLKVTRQSLRSYGRSGRTSDGDVEMQNAAGQKNPSGRMASDDEDWVSGGAVAAKENCRDRE